MPKISVIVPIFNCKKYLKRCIDSIIFQSFQDIEILLIDDGSTDGSSNICDEYAKCDARVKVIHKNNEGVSVARNTGLEIANGEWIAFVDSDDWLEQDFLSVLLLASEEQDVVISGFNTPKTYTDDGLIEYIRIVSKTFKANVCHHKIIRAHLIHDNKLYFDARFNFGEDSIFSLWVLLYSKSIRLINYKGYHYQANNFSVGEKYNQSIEDIHDKISAFRNIFNLLEQRFHCKFDLSHEIKSTIAFYPISHIIDGKENIYIELWTYYYGKNSVLELYQDSICSPYVNAITYIKQLATRQDYKIMIYYINRIYDFWGQKIMEIDYPYVSHRYISRILGRGYKSLTIFVLILYSLLKRFPSK